MYYHYGAQHLVFVLAIILIAVALFRSFGSGSQYPRQYDYGRSRPRGRRCDCDRCYDED